jgi:hypothetical protein
MTVLSFIIDMDPPGGAGDVYDSFEFYGIHGSSWARVKIVEHSTIYATQGHGDNLGGCPPKPPPPGPPRSLPTPLDREPDDHPASLASLAALGGSYFGRHPGPPPGQQGKLGWGVRLHCSPPRPGIGPL